MDQIAGTEARGEQRAREAPMVGPPAFRLVNRAGDANTRRLAARERSEAAEGTRRLLQLEELGLAVTGSRASAAREVTAAASMPSRMRAKAGACVFAWAS